jgi:hypothetical protein
MVIFFVRVMVMTFNVTFVAFVALVALVAFVIGVSFVFTCKKVITNYGLFTHPIRQSDSSLRFWSLTA